MHEKIQMGLICGGPSLERGISLNSARSVYDHLCHENINIIPFYVDWNKNFYALAPDQLYSNTPADFDFKLTEKLSEEELIQTLKKLDIVFPVIHGPFGEDGEIQSFFEQHDIPFVGSNSQSCRDMFNKDRTNDILLKNGYSILPHQIIFPGEKKLIIDFFHEYNLERAIIKPTAGGSSIGVFSANSGEEAILKAEHLFSMGTFDKAILEPFCYGVEFTVIVLHGHALIPTEIEVDYANGGLFDYRRKYLPTNNTFWHCPPRFNDETIAEIQKQAEALFKLFNARHFARFDGWVLENGTIIFTDLNPISGMEQNSFIFQQASRIGLTHRDVLCSIVEHALGRSINQPEKKETDKMPVRPTFKQTVRILCGGNTAERQVSIMSGTNAWLKLFYSKRFDPTLYFLDPHGEVWEIPYTYALNHTSEEIYENCLKAESHRERLQHLVNQVRLRLVQLLDINYKKKPFPRLAIQKIHNVMTPRRMTFEAFIEESKSFVFLALHGGDGENGNIQEKLEAHGIPYNGSGPKASRICMDKMATGEIITKMQDPAIISLPKCKTDNFLDSNLAWEDESSYIIKPLNDGCSAGVAMLSSHSDLQKYILIAESDMTFIPAYTLNNQTEIIEMPQEETEFFIEPFIQTDIIEIHKHELIYIQNTGWIELTVGFLGDEIFNPSITIAEKHVLTVEEKFQGGTGINITPPPENIISKEMRQKIKDNIAKVVHALGMENYGRIDIFFNVKTEQMIVIEANSLPALTPSTVIFHQALAAHLTPIQFFEKVIELALDHEKRHDFADRAFLIEAQ